MARYGFALVATAERMLVFNAPDSILKA